MLRFESNARTIDHNVIAQCSTNDGGMDFHRITMPLLSYNGKSGWLTACRAADKDTEWCQKQCHGDRNKRSACCQLGGG